MGDRQRSDQATDLPEFEEMRRLLGTPAELPLNLEERLEEQGAAGSNGLDDPGHPLPIEVVEDEHDVELAEIRPRRLEIGLDPLNRQAPATRLCAPFG